MKDNRRRGAPEREEVFHLEGHIVFMIVIILYFLSYPIMIISSDYVILSYLYSGSIVFLFAAIWKAISKLGSYNPKSVKGESNKIKSGNEAFIEECVSIINYYLGTNKGKAFTADSLERKMEDIVKNLELQKYLAKNIKNILEQMVYNETVAFYEKNGEIYYFL